jgi:hypothetical protein
MSETRERKLKIDKLQKQLDKLSDFRETLYRKHVYHILDYLRNEHIKNLSDVNSEIETINKQIMELIDKRDTAYAKQSRLWGKNIDKIIKTTKEIILVSEETKNKYTPNLKILDEKRDQIRFKISRLTNGKRLPQETDSPTLSVSVSPPRKTATRKKYASPTRKRYASPTRKKSASPAGKKSASPAGKKSSPSRKTSKRR